jgi:murein DD-endopeptidase MepM/ murein hydrolase activator NlpD
MARKFYTVFILPHAHARFRKLHLSRNFVLALVVLLGLTFVAGILSPHLLFKVRSQSEAMTRLEDERRELLVEKERFESSLSELSERIGSAESRALRMASALGIEEMPNLEPAAGGAPEGTFGDGVQGFLDEELDALSVRTESLEQSMAALSETWEERERLLASTPSVMPVRGWFSDGYGWRKDPMTSKRMFHKGLDIVAPVGAVVRAPADGVVTRASRTAGYGKMVDISHGYGYRTRYGHMSELLVKPGQRVRRGDAIGRIGSTGRSTGPHLHYEVFREGRRVNPWKYVGDRK